MPEKVAVIGSGIGGISVAIRLAAKGYAVTVIEKNERPGGKISEIRHQGYRFDTGPSLFTMPGEIEKLFQISGENTVDHFRYKKLDEVCRYFFHDGMVIQASGDPGEFARELNHQAGEDEGMVREYLTKSREMYDLVEPVFITNSLPRGKNYFSRKIIQSLLQINKIKPFHTLHEINSRYFRHENTIKIFDRFATYNGSNPYVTPATMMVIPHLEHNLGAYFPEKGMYDIVDQLVMLCRKSGVQILLNTPVHEILTEDKKVTGIVTARGEVMDFDYVISDIDIYYLYKDLLKKIPFPGKWFNYERSTSALIFYWGMEQLSSGLALHNILFANDYKEEFDYLFRKQELYPDPTVYLFISKKSVPGDAPDGCENWFVMINTPVNKGQDWDNIITVAGKLISDKILRMTGIDVEKYKKFEFVMDPVKIESNTSSYMGSLYGNSSNSMFSAFRRHPNFSGIKGLYCTGGSVHPGGGIPLCLSSAKIVAEMLPDLTK